MPCPCTLPGSVGLPDTAPVGGRASRGPAAAVVVVVAAVRHRYHGKGREKQTGQNTHLVRYESLGNFVRASGSALQGTPTFTGRKYVAKKRKSIPSPNLHRSATTSQRAKRKSGQGAPDFAAKARGRGEESSHGEHLA